MKIFSEKPVRYRHSDVNLGILDRLFIKSVLDQSSFNQRMFDEDFTRIFSYRNRDGGKFFDISSSDNDLASRLISKVQTNYASRSLDKIIIEWAEEIARSFLWFGSAHYILNDENDKDQIHIESFSSSGIAHLFGRHIQWVPKRTKRHWDRDDEVLSRTIRILDPDKVMCFTMPKAIKRMLSSQSRTLALLDRHQFSVADFQPHATHENPNPSTYFDFGTWRDTQESALYRATRCTGWNGRKYDASKRSDFFDCYRLIRFRRNQLVLRDEILSQISAEISRVGKRYNTGFSVRILGTDKLPNIAQLNEMEARLAREEVSFAEVIDYCLKR
ncbi:hypothetical protein [Mesorhizobium marinum]|uniref:hypothetical protein n=1 Tax=Mesorhizobium marinum TaxID=3228790 RepID=UPI003465D141